MDGVTAFTGGINISEVYSSGSLSRGKRKQKSSGWRDTHVMLQGPVVAEFQRIFLDTWRSQHGVLAPANYFPDLHKEGNDAVRAIASSPDADTSLMYTALMSAITHAELSIHITNSYFAPDPQLLDALKDAAKRGVDVKLILPSYSDFWPIFHAGRSHYADILKVGVQVYERENALLHAKTAVIDGVWSTVGSTNLDWRSFLHNDEIDAVILGTEFAEQMEAIFARDIASSSRVDIHAWRQRPLNLRIKEWAARLWEYWL